MNPMQLLVLRYPDPEVLGLKEPEDVTDLIKKLVNSLDIEDQNTIYNTVLAQLLTVEKAILTQQVETFTATGQITIVQGLQVRLRELRSELLAAQRAAGLRPVAGGLTVISGGVTWVPTNPRRRGEF